MLPNAALYEAGTFIGSYRRQRIHCTVYCTGKITKQGQKSKGEKRLQQQDRAGFFEIETKMLFQKNTFGIPLTVTSGKEL